MASDRVQRRIDRLLDQIEEAADQREWSQVIELAEDLLAFAPDNADARTFLEAAERRLSGQQGSRGDGRDSAASSPVSAVGAQPTHPTSFASGRYQVKRSLGEGGKKKVYLAHDTLLDREVAFALIKTEGLDEAGRSRIQREAQAMGRLGSHQHIVTVFDLGQEQDRPYMVTELMGGGDVESLIEKAPDHKIPLERAIDIAKEVSRGLEFAHGRGIVHRDLKPGNVWLTSEGVGKIGDFGLAVALDRSRLTTEGMMIGTVSYMPPEQAMGGEVSPRSDLYSLGAMLYEMVTGRPPFLGDDAVAIIGQHINTPPVSPTWHNGQCPRPLEALIMRLLAKNPSERPESAADVLSALDAIDFSEGPPLERGDGGISDPNALDSLAGGVFVGRQREMGELKACLEDALSGRGRLVTLVGEPGIGKTRTALELATYAGLRQAQVLWGRCYEGEGAPPYWPWVQAIRSYVRDVDPEQLRSDMGAGAADIGQVVSDVRDRLPGLEAPPELEPEQARFRLFDSITAFLKNAGRRQPLVLVLDDLHWADHPSLLLLEFVAKELATARVMIIGTYRDMELSRQHPLSRSLGELNRSAAGGFQRVLLRGLDQEDVGRFIELASGITPPAGMLEAVHRQTEGNPLFVTEVVRLLVQEGTLTGDPSTSGRGETEGRGEGESWSIRIPEGVREVIGRRLDRLSERCNETLTIASVVGREFTLEQLTPLIEDISGDRLLEVLDEALSARVIEELPRAVGRYQFTHALIQETLAGELSTTRKVRLHARIAEALELLYGADAEAHAAELAHHFAEAQTVLGTEKLVHYSRLAGERALAAYAFEEALAHFERGLVSRGITLTGTEPAPSGEVAGLLFGLARAQAATGAQRSLVQEAFDTLSRAFDYYAEAGDVPRAVAVAEYQIATPSLRLPGMTRPMVDALKLVPPDSHEAGRLLSRYGWVMGVAEGDYQGGRKAFGRAIAIAQREGDIALEMRTLAYDCAVSGQHLHLRESVDQGLRAIELAPRVHDLYHESIARGWVAVSQMGMGDLEGARLQAAAGLAVAERSRDRLRLRSQLQRNSLLACLEGDWPTARDFTDRGLLVASQDPRLLGPRVLLEYEVGEFGQGEAHLERLLEAMRLNTPSPIFEYTWPSIAVPIVARIIGLVDRFDVAEEAIQAVLSSPSATPLMARMARAGLALLAVQRADVPSAQEQYAALESGRGTMVSQGVSAVDRLLGLLSHTIGNLDQAAEHFEDALAFCREGGYRPELAWTCCDYADLLFQRNGEGDRAKAISLLDESLAIASDLGMRPLVERVLSRRDILSA